MSRSRLAGGTSRRLPQGPAGDAVHPPGRVIVISMAVVAAAAIVGTIAGFGTLDHCTSIACDFPTFHAQGRTVLEPPFRIAPGWKLPPFAALVFAPFGALSVGAATVAWEALNVALAGVLALACRRELRAWGRTRATLVAIAMVAASLPVVHCLKWGQVSLVTSVLAIVALGSPRACGPLLGALGAFKVYPAGYLLGPVCRRAWRVVLVAAVTALALGVIVPILVMGVGPTQVLIGNVLASATNAGQWANGFSTAYYGGQALGPAFQRWFADGGHVGLAAAGSPPLVVALPDGWAGPAATLAGLVVLAVTVVALARSRDASARAAALTLTAVTLIAQPAWHHYFAFLPFAQAVPLGDPRAPRVARGLAVASWIAAAAPLALLPLSKTAYFVASAWGATTVSALLAWAALVWVPRAGNSTTPIPKLQGPGRRR